MLADDFHILFLHNFVIWVQRRVPQRDGACDEARQLGPESRHNGAREAIPVPRGDGRSPHFLDRHKPRGIFAVTNSTMSAIAGDCGLAIGFDEMPL